MECLDEETILAFARGSLTPDTRRAAQDHIASCDECRVLVSAVVRSSSPNIDVMAPTTPLDPRAPSASAGPMSSPVSPGDILAGKYEIERVLGVGGMGVVVAARHTQLEQRVALKFLLPVACEVQGAVARFLREGKAAARITSEHVARVIDTGMLDGGAPYLVMEYLEGQDLGALVKDHGKVPPADAIEYVLQACEAVVEAHELGIVHRDLKPANLFLSKRADGSPLVKVLDFGISKIDGGSRSQLTSASVLMGSPRYMSPEQMLSAKDVDARADVWALGVILFELVCGRPVWEADTVQGLCALIAAEPPPPLRTFAPDAPAVLESVVARCLAKKRDERIASVADLALALAPIAPPSAQTSIDRILRVGKKSSAITASSSKKIAPPPSSSGRTAMLLVALVAVLLAIGVALNVTNRPRAEVPPPSTSSAPIPVIIVSAPPRVDTTAPPPPPPSSSVAADPPAPRTSVARALGSHATPIASVVAVPSAVPSATATASNRALTDRK